MSLIGHPFLEPIKREIDIIWAAHKAVGLKGKMCLYTNPGQEIWRTEESGKVIWFDDSDAEIEKALRMVEQLYNEGNLPNSPMLLNPMVFDVTDPKQPKPLGSGMAWSMSPALGIAELDEGSEERMTDIGALNAPLKRGENYRTGLKIICFLKEAAKPVKTGGVEGCKELYKVADIEAPVFYPYYMLSGMEYLTKNGSFMQPDFNRMLLDNEHEATPEQIVATHTVDMQRIKDANRCWHAYDHHHVLWKRFGIDAPKLDDNLKYYRLCGRDFRLLDLSGAKHADADTAVSFDFLVKGWVPKGAITIIGATGGTGKSSLAHNLAVKAAIDYEPGEERPRWLGADIDYDNCQGMSIYFSGEDGPAIVHSRAKVYDPKGRANRLMFLRTDFGEGVSFPEFMKRLRDLPDVPLLVIDPARKYLTGDEDDAGVVSEFFEAIEEFAIEKNAACVVVHHLVKGAHPENVADIYDLLRGSQVFIDRARVVIGMYREGPHIVAGLAKNNIPPQLGMVQGERLFLRDPEHLELRLVPGLDGIRGEDLTEEYVQQVLKDQENQQPDIAPALSEATRPHREAPVIVQAAPDAVQNTLEGHRPSPSKRIKRIARPLKRPTKKPDTNKEASDGASPPQTPPKTPMIKSAKSLKKIKPIKKR